jgi:chaperonin GroES
MDSWDPRRPLSADHALCVLRGSRHALIPLASHLGYNYKYSDSRKDPFMPTPQPKTAAWDVIEPVGKRVVIRKDDNKRETKSGIVLPGNHEILTLTGRVIAISKQIENDADFPIRQYDKVLFDPREAIPVEFESDNKLFVVPLDKVLAIFRKGGDTPAKSEEV